MISNHTTDNLTFDKLTTLQSNDRPICKVTDPRAESRLRLAPPPQHFLPARQLTRASNRAAIHKSHRAYFYRTPITFAPFSELFIRPVRAGSLVLCDSAPLAPRSHKESAAALPRYARVRRMRADPHSQSIHQRAMSSLRLAVLLAPGRAASVQSIRVAHG